MRVVFTKRAASELGAILEYIAERSPQGSRNVQIRILEKINLIAEQPGIGRFTRSGHLRRVAAAPYPYVIFYREIDNSIEIIAVRHGARRPSSMPR